MKRSSGSEADPKQQDEAKSIPDTGSTDALSLPRTTASG
eukprot:CAMPEP_0180643436 /NCGR_PEP_ID=MMETSP1037_2-20121125/47815_1 /TAXON_ID=632150 /ORGANISM="Azadinium spinosum, Strain 3D9" /LENGTH=38 /DNA_ID= /DNA_START= /DNA_END= /DNA_ORIENTATION=